MVRPKLLISLGLFLFIMNGGEQYEVKKLSWRPF
jgi:hypothetical protein